MTGIAVEGAQSVLNHLTGAAFPVISSSAPTWIPGMSWVNTTTNPPVLYGWNGVSWSPANTGGQYVALLTSDPSGLTTIAQLSECTDAGYTRQQVPFNPATAAIPSVAANTNLVQYGPFTVNMSLPVQWLALVTTSSGTSGFLKQTWTLSQQWQVLATQTIDIPAGALTITEQ